MGRELRRVPGDWQHPKNASGRYVPLHGRSFAVDDAEWAENFAQWMKGKRRSYAKDSEPWVDHGEPCTVYACSKWHGDRPNPAAYMPDWPECERTHFQWYENVSEGTPLSPPMPTAEALAKWLSDNPGRSVPALSVDEWRRVIEQGFAFSMVMSPGVGVIDGATFAARQGEAPGGGS